MLGSIDKKKEAKFREQVLRVFLSLPEYSNLTADDKNKMLDIMVEHCQVLIKINNKPQKYSINDETRKAKEELAKIVSSQAEVVYDGILSYAVHAKIIHRVRVPIDAYRETELKRLLAARENQRLTRAMQVLEKQLKLAFDSHAKLTSNYSNLAKNMQVAYSMLHFIKEGKISPQDLVIPESDVLKSDFNLLNEAQADFRRTLEVLPGIAEMIRNYLAFQESEANSEPESPVCTDSESRSIFSGRPIENMPKDEMPFDELFVMSHNNHGRVNFANESNRIGSVASSLSGLGLFSPAPISTNQEFCSSVSSVSAATNVGESVISPEAYAMVNEKEKDSKQTPDEILSNLVAQMKSSIK